MELADLATTTEAAQYLRRMRKAAGLTQEELALQVGDGLSQGYVSRIENGHIQPHASRYLQMVAICDPTARLQTSVEGGDNGR